MNSLVRLKFPFESFARLLRRTTEPTHVELVHKNEGGWLWVEGLIVRLLRLLFRRGTI